MSKLDILVGLPGIGKSTLAKTMASPGSKIIDVDSFRYWNGGYNFNPDAEEEIFTQSLFAAKGYEHVIYDDCYWTNTHARRNALIAAMQCLYHFDYVQFFVLPQLPNEGLKNRIKDSKGLSAVIWEKAIKELSAEYEPVHDSQFWRTKHITLIEWRSLFSKGPTSEG